MLLFSRGVIFSVHIFLLNSILFFNTAIAKYTKTRKDYIMVALGDSITNAMNASGIGDQPQYSWSTGNHPRKIVNSHFLRIKKQLDRKIIGHNFSVSGAMAHELKEQVAKTIPLKPDYVTLLIGANDVCSWPKQHEKYLKKMRQDLENNIDKLIKSNPEIKINMLPLPNMINLWKLGKSNGCQWRWDIFWSLQEITRIILNKNR